MSRRYGKQSRRPCVLTGEAFDLLKDLLDAGRAAHAYVVAGDPKGGGMELVDRVAEYLFCEKESKPCGACRGCRMARGHKHPDMQIIEPELKTRRISVVQMRGVQKMIYQGAYCGGWKVCVVASAERLVVEGANAFLKTLEEPPEKTIFFLITASPQFLLPTVKSRCQQIVVSGGETQLAPEWAAEIAATLAGAGKAGGSDFDIICRAERMLRLLKLAKKTAESETPDTDPATGEDVGEKVLKARVEARYRWYRESIMRMMVLWFRDMFILAAGADEKTLALGQFTEQLRASARGIGVRKAVRNVALVEKMGEQMERNLQESHVLNMGFAKIG